MLAALTPLVAAAAEPTVATVPAAGHLAFVTATGALDIVAVLADGTTTDPVQIAPVTQVAAPKTVKVLGITVSADKNWLAWAEETFRPTKRYGEIETGSVIARRNMYTG